MTALVACLMWFLRTANKDTKRVILISIDTLRADYLGCYGCPDKLTPGLDKFAQENILFEHVVTAAPLTLPSHSTILTGTLPPYHGVRNNLGYKLNDANLTIAEMLKDNGFATGAIVSSYVLDAETNINQGFDTYADDFEYIKKDGFAIGRRGHEATSLAIDWLKKHLDDDKFFLFLHYFDPHTPYDPPGTFAQKHAENPYAGEVAYTDQCVGNLLDALKEVGLYESTMIIIVSDHGEMLGEHGESEHGFFLYESAIKVPMIIKPAGTTKNQRIENIVSLVDVMPTICYATGIPIPKHVQGKNLCPYFTGQGSQSDDRQLYCETFYPTQYNGNSLSAVVTKNWKYIHSERPELYEIEQDTAETNNLFDSQLKRAHLLHEHLKLMVEQYSNHEKSGEIPISPEQQKQLESLGYVAGATNLADNPSGQTTFDPKDLIYSYEQQKTVKACLKVEQYDKAGAICAKMVAENGKNVLYFLLALGDVDIELGRWDDAIVHFSDLLSRLEENIKNISEQPEKNIEQLSHIYQQLGKTYFKQQKFEQSLEYLNKALAITTNPTTELYNNTANIMQQIGKNDEAVECWEKSLQIDPNQMLLHNSIARYFYQKGQTARAVEQLSNALKIKPDAAEVHFNLAGILFKEGDLSNAIVHYEAAIKLNPELPGAQEKLQTAQNQEKLQAAISSWQEALKQNPQQPDLHEKLGAAFYNQKNMKQAIYHWETALRLQPDQIDLLNNLGWILATYPDEQIRNPQKAIAYARQACELGQFSTPESLDTLAAAYAIDGQFNEAVDTAQKAIALATETKNQTLASEIEKRLQLYKNKQSYIVGNAN
jgi:arylsulfatase A-like enzyme/Tfp pilus assembly protein PilF